MPADAIRSGCSVLISRDYQSDPNDSLSTQIYSLLISWQCDDGENSTIGTFPVEGASPEIVTIFYWDNENIISLVKWPMSSQAADYSGNYYKIYAYTYNNHKFPRRFFENTKIERNFPPGFDGLSRDGTVINYPFKDIKSIKRKLREAR
ncbi:hypothetical protein [Pandoraea cepalis]|uniref:hypothetical protein n=1 Tax=Pandoraea cepalis TaxID=2508294 RepID=UPI00123F09B7|nr:hypothetical protein [Pandoraea cepalis]